MENGIYQIKPVIIKVKDGQAECLSTGGDCSWHHGDLELVEDLVEEEWVPADKYTQQQAKQMHDKLKQVYKHCMATYGSDYMGAGELLKQLESKDDE